MPALSSGGCRFDQFAKAEYATSLRLCMSAGTKQAAFLDENVTVCEFSWALFRQIICDGASTSRAAQWICNSESAELSGIVLYESCLLYTSPSPRD